MNTIEISIKNQTLTLLDAAQKVLQKCLISTAQNGAGEQKGSFCTPRGLHIIRAKIGQNAPENAVFIARRQTGEIFNAELFAQFPKRDWILTRILWLSGCEIGKNRLGKVDTMRRFIYIHGAPDFAKMGIPESHGCIRMKNAELIVLFEQVSTGTKVLIHE